MGDALRLAFHSLDTPAVCPLIPHTGKQRDTVVTGSGGAAGICLQYLFYTDHLIGACAQLGGPGNGIAWLQGMQVSKIIPDPAVVTRNAAVAVPDTSAREMTGPFCQSAAVCPFVDLRRPW